MPHNKNLAIRKLNNAGRTLCRSTYGVKFERQTEANNNKRQKIPCSKKERKDKNPFRFHRATGPEFNFCQKAVARLKKISASTIGRLLKPIKARVKTKGTNGTKPAAGHLKKLVPTLSHFECVEQGEGLWQIDPVQDGGGNTTGEFCYTLAIAEVKNAWTAHYALKNKAHSRTFQALADACSQLPLPVRILRSNNGSEFINLALTAHGAVNKG
ncbi:MAG: hypothetical protein LBH43_04560 [Treponema sp.]|jgi:hypothetical protein|nr:hypothetical protein [Treponema sp.]